jgi:hypothetical protein
MNQYLAQLALLNQTGAKSRLSKTNIIYMSHLYVSARPVFPNGHVLASINMVIK